jgi:hypothetical protein
MTPSQPGVPRPTTGSAITTSGPVTATRVAAAKGEPPLKDVLVELWQNTEKLVRQELALATAELELKAQKLKAEVAASALGAGLCFAAALALVASVILLLALIMPAWLAAFLTSSAAGGIGFGLLKTSRPSMSDVTPERTLQNLEKDLQTFTEPSK